MKLYRLYFMDGDGHILSRAEFECESDEELEKCVAQNADGRAMEVWQGTLFLRKYTTREAMALVRARTTAD